LDAGLDEGGHVSLAGNLEDLPLLDIIQIVSFSKKTGFLTIRSGSGEGAIVFLEGLVVSSFAWDSLPVDPRAAQLAPEKRDALVRNRISMALEQLIRLRDGQFNFSLTTKIPATIGSRQIADETLAVGINAQELLLNLARGMDEDRRDSSAALEASFAQPGEDFAAEGELEEDDVQPPPLPPAVARAPKEPLEQKPPPPPVEPPEPAPKPPKPSKPAILLVDDEDDIRQTLSERFRKAGYTVVEAADPGSAVKAARGLRAAGDEFLLVTDLGMPTSGGASFHGGLEIVKRLTTMKLKPPVLLMTDSLSGAVQKRARQLQISHFVFKPGLSKLDSAQFQADLRAFANKLISDVLPSLKRSRGAEPKAPKHPTAGPARKQPQGSQELRNLQRHLEQLRQPSDPSPISRLAMTVAREFFERGILFLVKEDKARGLGGFGLAPDQGNLSLLVRDIAIPLSDASMFRDVFSSRKGWSGSPPDDAWTRHLTESIGRFSANEIALLPLITHREVVALLYGDNPASGRELGALDALEVFIDQAGVALEKLFLERKLASAEHA
jgi:CheY-like chemotaxis protein